jgi:formyltetrahydrofolate-dependent phosphoribosylglycinamide formyltransferase
MSMRMAVMASGRGSNLRALHEYFAASERSRVAEIALVISDRPDAGALEYARANGIRAAHADAREGAATLASLLASCGIELLLLAGYLRLVPAGVVAAYRGRVVNVHPALLPAFGGQGMYGERVHRAVLASGARVTGVTVHFVDEQYDRGAIIAQWPVPVLAGDTEHTLAARVLHVEHLLFPRAVEAVARGRVALDRDGRAHHASPASGEAVFTLVPGGDAALAAAMDAALAIAEPR